MKINKLTQVAATPLRKSEDSHKKSEEIIVNTKGGSNVLVLILVSLIVVPRFCYGYVDPGAGHLIWQTAVSGFIGMLFFVRKFVQGIKDRANKSLRSNNSK